MVTEWLAAMRPPPARQLTTEIRSYLFERTKTMDSENDIFRLLKTAQDEKGNDLILLGPTIDTGSTIEHFQFDSGARLSFHITVHDDGQSSPLLPYRFHPD